MLMPLAIDSSMAGMPSGVAGILIITFGRPSVAKSRFASADRARRVAARAAARLRGCTKPSPPLRLVVDGPEDVGGVADVFDGELVVDLVARFVLRGEHAQLRVVVVAAADRLLEDRRIRGQAAQVVFIDHPLQLAAGDEPALHLIVPDALPGFCEFSEGIAHQEPPKERKAYRYCSSTPARRIACVAILPMKTLTMMATTPPAM